MPKKKLQSPINSIMVRSQILIESIVHLLIKRPESFAPANENSA